MAVALAKRGLGLQQLGRDETLDHHLRLGRDQQIDRLRLHHVQRLADQPARNPELVELFRHLLDGGERDHRRTAEDDGAGHRLAALLPRLPVHVAAGPELDRRVHADPVGRLQHPPVVAHVLDAGLRVLGDEMRRGGVGRVVPSGRGDRHRQRVEPVSAEQLAVPVDDLVARRVLDQVGLYGRVHRPDPVLLDLVQRHAHAHLVDPGVGREAAYQDRDVEIPPLGIGDVGEQERLAVLGVDPAAELPAHQRVHLGVLVDPPVDLDQQPGLAQRRDMFVEIVVTPRRHRHGRWTPSAAPARRAGNASFDS